jgi:hypothetical protein
MINWLEELRGRNQLLFWTGLYFFLMTVFCLIQAMYSHESILGTANYLKPLKYFTTLCLMSWTLGWLISYADSKTVKKIVPAMASLSMIVYSAIILFQANKSTTSHYNTSSPFNTMMYYVMCVMALLFLISIFVLTFSFFRQRKIKLSQHYTWGIRMGLAIFCLSLLVGMLMVVLGKHSIGGPDGSKGLHFLNWSKKYGDLRVSHLMGLFSLQIIPLLSYYWFKTKVQVLAFSFLYLLVFLAFLITALVGLPLIP